MILTITDWAGDRVSLEPRVELYSVRDFMGEELPGLAIVLDEVGSTPDRAEEYAVLTVSSGFRSAAKQGRYIDTNNMLFCWPATPAGHCRGHGIQPSQRFLPVSPLAVQGRIPEGNRRGELSRIPAVL